jgi:glutathione-specific gamma-glutamylcyclotransferase
MGAETRRRDFWVFGYGSLMWRPGFSSLEQRQGLVRGWSRRLCVYSHIYRGTPERPGLVLGLDRGGSCHGVGFRVAPSQWPATLGYLRERELVTAVYLERDVRLDFGAGASATALTYVADRRHAQYAGRLERSRLLELVGDSHGQAGANAEYVLNTQEHLAALAIHDSELEWLAGELRRESLKSGSGDRSSITSMRSPGDVASK